MLLHGLALKEFRSEASVGYKKPPERNLRKQILKDSNQDLDCVF